MSTLSMGDHSVQENDQHTLEQARLEALIQLTTSHKKEVQGLLSQLESAERKANKLEGQVKALDNELKAHRASNPDRMKKQIKRLQEQNRVMVVENNTLKAKQKQIQQQLQSSKLELERLRNEKKDSEEAKEAKEAKEVKEAKETKETKDKVAEIE